MGLKTVKTEKFEKLLEMIEVAAFDYAYIRFSEGRSSEAFSKWQRLQGIMDVARYLYPDGLDAWYRGETERKGYDRGRIAAEKVVAEHGLTVPAYHDEAVEIASLETNPEPVPETSILEDVAELGKLSKEFIEDAEKFSEAGE